jgi:hypothetical protein
MMMSLILLATLSKSLASQLLFFNTSTQTTSFTRLSFPLTLSRFPYLLLTLDTQPPADVALGVLLLADLHLQPYVQIESSGHLEIRATYSDLVSFALRKNRSILQLNTTNLVAGDIVYIGMYSPQRPYSGIPYQLSGTAHCNF